MTTENRRVATICMGLCTLFTSLSWMAIRMPMYYEKYIKGTGSMWFMSAYIIAEVSTVILAGVLVDKIGSKNCTVMGVAMFVAGALGVYITQDPGLLITYRIIQGLGAGFIFCVGVAFIPKAYDKSERLDPHKVMILTFALGSIFGTAVGMFFLKELHDWRLFFLIAAVAVLVFGLLAYRTLPVQEKHVPRDLLGMILTVSSIASFMTYTQMIDVNFDLFSWQSLAFLEFCLIQLFALIYVEKKAKNPLLPQGIKKTHIGLLVSMFIVGFCGIGMLQFLTMFLLVYYKLSLYNASLMLFCMIAGGATTSIIGTRIVYRTGIRPLVLTGPIITMIGFVGAYFLFTEGLVFAGCALFVIGLGFGTVVTEMLVSLQATSPLKDAGAYTGMLMAVRFIGIIFGMAVYNHFILVPVKKSIAEVKTMSIEELISHILTNFTDLLDKVLGIFSDAVHSCCIVAAITVLIGFVVAYFFVGKEDIDAPERNE